MLLALFLIAIPGCSGCRRDEPKSEAEKAAERKKKEEEEKKKKEKPKPPFEFEQVRLLPGQRDKPSLFVKPGHWVDLTQGAIANDYDMVGRMQAAVVDRRDNPIYLDGTPYRLTTTRPVALPKGQEKHLDMTVFVPLEQRRHKLFYQLESRRSGAEVQRGNEFFATMPPYKYFFVVLARNRDNYSFLKTLDSVRFPWMSRTFRDAPYVHYEVVTPQLESPLLLPSMALTWTSIAYVLWDDCDPTLFSLEQQQALIDWLHWGGQLVISGPDSLDELEGSFLSEYLPATAGSEVQLGETSLADMNRIWTLPEKREPGPELKAVVPWSAVELKKHPAAESLDSTGNLVIERRIGRGRVVVSAFRLAQRELKSWHGYDGFFNAVLLRRPPRRYEEFQFETRLRWHRTSGPPTDPRKTTSLRWFARDAADQRNFAVNYVEQVTELGQVTTDVSIDEKSMGGVASWNSFSGIAHAARNTLREAAGIVVPKRSFVLWTLGLYLLILVPLNWLAFYVIGKVEWAWVAAPLVAVVFSLLVVKFAQLDIGFARAHTEIALVETHGGYPRAHLSRYTALYTSLSTNYDVHFESDEALAQPFPMSRQYRPRSGERYSMVTFRRGFGDAHLEGLQIASNTTGMVHSEQMIDLGGSLHLDRNKEGRPIVVNDTELTLSEVAVLRKRLPEGLSRSSNVRMDLCYIGQLRPHQAASLGFKTFAGEDLEESLRDALAGERGRASEEGLGDRLDLELLYEVAEDPATLARGETRLVGRVDDLMPGASVEPAASQVRAATLVLVHLDAGDLPPPEPDANTKYDFLQDRPTRGNLELFDSPQ